MLELLEVLRAHILLTKPIVLAYDDAFQQWLAEENLQYGDGLTTELYQFVDYICDSVGESRWFDFKGFNPLMDIEFVIQHLHIANGRSKTREYYELKAVLDQYKVN